MPRMEVAAELMGERCCLHSEKWEWDWELVSVEHGIFATLMVTEVFCFHYLGMVPFYFKKKL